MRARKVYENVHFQRGADPKASMGLGRVNLREFRDLFHWVDWVVEMLPHMLGEDEIPKDILSTNYWNKKTGNEAGGGIPSGLYRHIIDWMNQANDIKPFSIGGEDIIDWKHTYSQPRVILTYNDENGELRSWTTALRKKLNAMGIWN